MTGGTSRPGRRPDPSLNEAILAAVVEVLADVGYGGLTMDAVAAAAGVSKASIYRRWPTKTDLLVSVINAASDDSLTASDTGSLREDLILLLTALADILIGPGGAASRALLGASTAEPAMAAAFRDGPMARWGVAFGEAFGRAAARGDVTTGAATSHAAETGASIILKRWLITGQEVEGDLPRAVVDQVMMPLLERYRPGR